MWGLPREKLVKNVSRAFLPSSRCLPTAAETPLSFRRCWEEEEGKRHRDEGEDVHSIQCSSLLRCFFVLSRYLQLHVLVAWEEPHWFYCSRLLAILQSLRAAANEATVKGQRLQ